MTKYEKSKLRKKNQYNYGVYI